MIRTFSIQILWIYLGFFPHIVLTWSWTHVPTIPLVQANWNLLTTSLLSIYEGCRGWVHFFKYHSIIMLCFCQWWYCCTIASIYYFNSGHMNIYSYPLLEFCNHLSYTVLAPTILIFSLVNAISSFNVY